MRSRLTVKVANVFFKKKTKDRIPKSLVAFFLILHFCFGIDCGFAETLDGKKRTFVKRASLLTGFGVAFALLISIHTTEDQVWIWCESTKFILQVVFLKTASYKIYHFLNDLHEISDSKGINNNWIGAVIAVYTVAAFAGKAIPMFVCFLSETISRCTANNDAAENGFIFIADTVSGVLIVVMYYMLCVVKDMKKRFETDKDLQSFERSYIALVKSYDRVRPLYERMFVIELFMDTPRLITTLWYALVFIKQQVDWYAYVSEAAAAFHIVTQVCAPAVIAGMVLGVVTDLKDMLEDLAREETDRAVEILSVSRYMSSRRPLQPAWGVVPLDLRLPLALFNFCTTYFIVLLQFTHLYD